MFYMHGTFEKNIFVNKNPHAILSLDSSSGENKAQAFVQSHEDFCVQK